MRIAWGIHGYGRGHVTRSLPIIKALLPHHFVKIYAGGLAYKFLKPLHLDVTKIPYFSFYQSQPGKVNNFLTFFNNLPNATDLFAKGPELRRVRKSLKKFKPHVLITDSEPWSCWAAHDLQIPIISFDHYGIIAHCNPRIPLSNRLRVKIDKSIYRMMVPSPRKILVSSFYSAPSKKVKIIPPILREEVKQFFPVQGNHVLAYFSGGGPQDIAALQSFSDVRLYGTDRKDKKGSITFKEPDNEQFLWNLATCSFVISSAGNQLTGEAIYYNKPLLVVPEDSAEQRLNARSVEKLGIGMNATCLSLQNMSKFVKNLPQYRSKICTINADGTQQAIDTISKWLKELEN